MITLATARPGQVLLTQATNALKEAINQADFSEAWDSELDKSGTVESREIQTVFGLVVANRRLQKRHSARYGGGAILDSVFYGVLFLKSPTVEGVTAVSYNESFGVMVSKDQDPTREQTRWFSVDEL